MQAKKRNARDPQARWITALPHLGTRPRRSAKAARQEDALTS